MSAAATEARPWRDALQRLEWTPRGEVPFVAQRSAADCGAAALAMILAFHGRRVPLDELRARMGGVRDGISAAVIAETARAYGLRPRALTVDLDDLRHAPRGSILFWGFDHWVVLDRTTRAGVRIVDPAGGRRAVPRAEVSRRFTGLLLTFAPTDAFERGGTPPRGLARYLAVLRRHGRLVAQVVATSALIQVLGGVGPFVTGMLVDRGLPRQDVHLFVVLAAGLALVSAFAWVAEWLRQVLQLHLRTHIELEMTVGFVEHLVALPFAFFQGRPAGDLLMRMNSNALARDILASGTLSSLLDGALVNAYLLLLFLADARLGLLACGLALAQIVLFLLFRRRRKELMTEALEVSSKAQAFQVEMLSGVETLKALAAEERALEHWTSLFADSQNVGLRRGWVDALVGSLNGAVRGASSSAMFFACAWLVLHGELTVGTLMAIVALAGGVFAPLSSLVATGTQLQLLASYGERIDEVLDAPAEPPARAQSAPALTGEITVERVSFAYDARSQHVLDGISLHVEPGEHLAIVGASGSGKSTLAKVLAGLHLPTSGRVLHDGHDLSGCGRSLRAQAGVVPQSAQLFSLSVRDNIAFGAPDATLSEVVEAARVAGLHDFVRSLPMGYDTLLADRGSCLSGGQRQRLAVARALLRRPRILVLDEATSALDAASERALVEALAALDCTRITVAHRLSTVRDATRIVVLDRGRIVEQGTHDELLGARGAYAALQRAQL